MKIDLSNRSKSELLYIVVALQVAAAVFLIRFSLHNRFRYEVPVNVTDLYSLYAQQDENGWYITGSLDIGGIDRINLLYGPYVHVDRGSYTLSVDYDCQVDQTFLIDALDTIGHYIKANDVIMDCHRKHLEYDFDVREPIDNLETVFHYNGDGNYRVSGIRLYRNYNDLLRKGLYAIIASALAVMILALKAVASEKRKTVLALAGIAFLGFIPMLFNGINLIPGQDLEFHLLRIEGIVQEWRNGHFPSYNSSVWLGGYGYPVSVFYGDIMLYIPAVFRLLGVGVSASYKVFCFLVQCLTVILSYLSFQWIFKKHTASLILTLVYSVSCYRLTDLYIRSAVGEYIAIAFLPLVAAAVFRIFRREGRFLTNVAALAVGMSGIVTSHVVSAITVTLTLCLICLICIKKTVNGQVILAFIAGAGLSILLCLYFLVPFLDYYLHVPVAITAESDAAKIIQHRGISLADLFVFYRGDGESLLTPGIVLISVLIVAVVLLLTVHTGRRFKLLLFAGMFYILISTGIFPWDFLCRKLPLINLAAVVQFPWRYLAIAILFLTLLTGELLDTELSSVISSHGIALEKWLVILSLISVILFTASGAQGFRLHTVYDKEELNTYDVMAGEYLLQGTEGIIFDGAVHAESGEVELIAEDTDGHRMVAVYRNGDPIQEGEVSFPIYNYKGFAVYGSDHSEFNIKEDLPLLTAVIPAGYQGDLYVDFAAPAVWKYAQAISVLAWFALFISIICMKKRK